MKPRNLIISFDRPEPIEAFVTSSPASEMEHLLIGEDAALPEDLEGLERYLVYSAHNCSSARIFNFEFDGEENIAIEGPSRSSMEPSRGRMLTL